MLYGLKIAVAVECLFGVVPDAGSFDTALCPW